MWHTEVLMPESNFGSILVQDTRLRKKPVLVTGSMTTQEKRLAYHEQIPSHEADMS